MRGARTLLAFGDLHIPHQNRKSVEIFCRVAKRMRPDLIVCLGDLLDCGQFSTHPQTYNVTETDYEDDLAEANDLLDVLQRYCTRLVMIEGNHEYRIDRWAARTTAGRGAHKSLAPRIRLSRGRKRFTYVPYGQPDGHYPHYKINGRIVAVHGWSYAIHATANHLRMSQGMSMIHGHTHRVNMAIVQSVWSKGAVVQAVSAGCLCQQIPFWGTGRVVEWVNAFVVGYLGKRDDTMYAVPIVNGRCILPDGTEIKGDG